MISLLYTDMGPLHWSSAFPTFREHRIIVQLCAIVYQLGWSLLRIWKDGQMTMVIIVIIMMFLIDDDGEDDDDDDNDGDQAISIENIWRDHCWLRLRSSPWAHPTSSWDDGMMITMDKQWSWSSYDLFLWEIASSSVKDCSELLLFFGAILSNWESHHILNWNHIHPKTLHSFTIGPKYQIRSTAARELKSIS